jgi:hypothetical protein
LVVEATAVEKVDFGGIDALHTVISREQCVIGTVGRNAGFDGVTLSVRIYYTIPDGSIRCFTAFKGAEYPNVQGTRRGILGLYHEFDRAGG